MLRPFHVNEVYLATQGEGLFVGVPTIFIRFQGCSLHCSYCDSLYSVPFGEKAAAIGEGQYLELPQLIEKIREVNTPHTTHFCLTGGEPLQVQRAAFDTLIWKLLADFGARIVIETGGHIPTNTLLEGANRYPSSVHLCVDYKLPSSGMTGRMRSEAFSSLRPTDSIKYVCADESDYQAAKTHLSSLS